METNKVSNREGPTSPAVPPLVDLMRRFVIQRRREIGQTQDDLATAAGVSKGLISMLEGGRLKGPPKTANLLKLARGLNVDPEILIQLSQGREDQAVMDDGGVLKPLPPNLPAHLQSLGRALFEAAGDWPPGRRKRRGAPHAAGKNSNGATTGNAAPSLPTAAQKPGPGDRPSGDLGIPEQGVPPSDEFVEIPFFGQVGCGRFLHLQDYPIELRKIPATLARGTDGLVEAAGDSMVGAGIYPGMTIVVKRQNTADNGQVVLVNIPYLGTAVRRLKITQDGPYLVSQGPSDYPPIRVEGDVRIVGRVKHAYSVLSFE